MTSTYTPEPTRIAFGKLAIAGAVFGVIFAPTFWYFASWPPPRVPTDYLILAILALVSGGTFGVLIGWFGNSKAVARQTAIALPAGEVLEHQGSANHFRNIEARGGRLYLTNRNLIFRPHQFNVQGGDVTIPRADIARVSTSMTLGIIPNGLKVTRRDGTTERFVVSDRSDWVRRMTQKA